MAEKGNFTFSAIVEEENIHQNIKQSIIVISEDKMRLLMHKYKDSLEGNLFWLTPFGVFVSLLITNLTAEFSGKYGLSGEMWSSIFIVFNLGFLTWTAIAFYKRAKRMSQNDLIDEMKKSKQS